MLKRMMMGNADLWSSNLVADPGTGSWYRHIVVVEHFAVRNSNNDSGKTFLKETRA